MNDIELAARISPSVADSLAIAKEVIEDYPEHCLVKLRAMCKMICHEVVAAKNLAVLKNEDLALLIAKIIEQLRPDQPTRHAFHTLRYSGNKGAHPEKFQLAPAQFSELARIALSQSVTVLKFAYSQLHPSASLPCQIDTAPISSGLKSLCYKATVDENADAQYLIGMRFLREAESLHREFYDPASQSECRMLGDEYHYALEKSRFWFKFASFAGHPGALYEYGRALAEGKEGEDLIYMGVNQIHRAAVKGDSNANYFVGNIYCQGLHDYEVNYVEARSHFEIAADEDHPEALMALAEMYRFGKGVEKDPESALKYTRRSAEAGYPKAQFQLYEYYKNGTIVNKDEERAIHWLKSSSDQKFWPAMYRLAEYIVHGKISECHTVGAEELFRRCLNSVDIEVQFAIKAKLHMASLCMLRSPTFQNISDAILTIPWAIHKSESRSKEIIELVSSLRESAYALLRKFINEQGIETQEGRLAKYFLDSFVTLTASQAQKADRKTAPSVKPKPSIGRNEFCPCGSGRKYKKCHGL